MNVHLKPGFLEVFTGPMKSGKTNKLRERVEKLHYMDNCAYILFKPSIDTRDDDVRSRFAEQFSFIRVEPDYPQAILDLVQNKHKLIAIDEANFFDKKLLPVIHQLLVLEKNVIVCGLDTDFRGEPFGAMPDVLAIADEVHKLQGVCEHDGCNEPSTQTQRLVDGLPTQYTDPLILIGDAQEGYQTRCRKHHVVPGKPAVTETMHKSSVHN